jgi:hypothetical protein
VGTYFKSSLFSLAVTLCVYAGSATAARRHGGEVATVVSDAALVRAPQSAIPTTPTPSTPPVSAVPINSVPLGDAPPSDVVKATAEKSPEMGNAADYVPPKKLEGMVEYGQHMVKSAYRGLLWVLGMSQVGENQLETGRTAASRWAWTLVALFVLSFGGGVYYVYKKGKNKVSQSALAEAPPMTEWDPKTNELIFDPRNRVFRIVLEERTGQKVALLEVLDLKTRHVTDTKELLPSSVLLAQYLPASKQIETGVLNGLEQVKYMFDWKFERTMEEVRIKVREISLSKPAETPAAAEGNTENTNTSAVPVIQAGPGQRTTGAGDEVTQISVEKPKAS